MQPYHITPPKPMTASVLMSHLEMLADEHDIEDRPIYINNEPIVNVTVANGRTVVQTAAGYFNANSHEGQGKG